MRPSSVPCCLPELAVEHDERRDERPTSTDAERRAAARTVGNRGSDLSRRDRGDRRPGRRPPYLPAHRLGCRVRAWRSFHHCRWARWLLRRSHRDGGTPNQETDRDGETFDQETGNLTGVSAYAHWRGLTVFVCGAAYETEPDPKAHAFLYDEGAVHELPLSQGAV